MFIDQILFFLSLYFLELFMFKKTHQDALAMVHVYHNNIWSMNMSLNHTCTITTSRSQSIVVTTINKQFCCYVCCSNSHSFVLRLNTNRIICKNGYEISYFMKYIKLFTYSAIILSLIPAIVFISSFQLDVKTENFYFNVNIEMIAAMRYLLTNNSIT